MSHRRLRRHSNLFFKIDFRSRIRLLIPFAIAGSLFASWPAEVLAQKQNQIPRMFQNVELTDQQKNQIKEISQKLRERLVANQKKVQEVYTDDQRQARRELIRKLRDEGKSNTEIQERLRDAIQLSDEQLQSLNELAKERAESQRESQAEYTAILSPEQRRTRPNQARGPRIAPTHADVSYGPHERNVMDVWLAKSEKPTPVFFSIHGGGFRAGNKGVDSGLLKACLDQGISVVAITYRLSGEAIAPVQFHDSARAIQFVRSKAGDWNVDKTRIASSGGSAGAGISLWLAFHDDLGDPKNSDPVLRESTRLKCAIVFNGQTTYDPREIKKLIPEADTFRHSALAQLYNVDLSAEFNSFPKQKTDLFEECSPITHFDKDDVPVMLAYAAEQMPRSRARGSGFTTHDLLSF